MLQSAASVNMGDNAAFEMLDYVISLREGIMDAWSGAILAMRKEKRKCLPSQGSNFTDQVSTNLDAVRGIYFHGIERHRSRPQSKRGSSSISYGSYRVSFIECCGRLEYMIDKCIEI